MLKNEGVINTLYSVSRQTVDSSVIWIEQSFGWMQDQACGGWEAEADKNKNKFLKNQAGLQRL